jgi:hypothetical protein
LRGWMARVLPGVVSEWQARLVIMAGPARCNYRAARKYLKPGVARSLPMWAS